MSIFPKVFGLLHINQSNFQPKRILVAIRLKPIFENPTLHYINITYYLQDNTFLCFMTLFKQTIINVQSQHILFFNLIKLFFHFFYKQKSYITQVCVIAMRTYFTCQVCLKIKHTFIIIKLNCSIPRPDFILYYSCLHETK